MNNWYITIRLVTAYCGDNITLKTDLFIEFPKDQSYCSAVLLVCFRCLRVMKTNEEYYLFLRIIDINHDPICYFELWSQK